MNAVASTNWNLERDPQAAGMAAFSATEGVPVREKLIAMRDTMIVLSLQLSFRLIMLLRSWNY
jgi:hypothetical protein